MPALIVKKEEKVEAVFVALGEDITESRFVEKFKEMYPKDWEKVKAKYDEEERKTKPGKTHPMPYPDVYIKNMYINAVKKKETGIQNRRDRRMAGTKE